MKRIITMTLIMIITLSMSSQSLRTLQRQLDSVKLLSDRYWDTAKIHENEADKLYHLSNSAMKAYDSCHTEWYNLNKSGGDSLKIADLKNKSRYYYNLSDSLKELGNKEMDLYEVYRSKASSAVYKISSISEAIRVKKYEIRKSNLINKYGESTAKRLLDGDVWVGMTYQMMKDAEYDIEIYYQSEYYELGVAGYDYVQATYFKAVNGVVKAASYYYIRPN